MNQKGLSKFIIIFSIVIVLIWLVLGGLYFWQKFTGKKDSSQDQEQPAVNINQPATNQPLGQLPSSGQKTGDEQNGAESFLGYIRKVEEKLGNDYLTIDYVEWLTGDEAKQAALADGACTILADCAPNGFYIRNASQNVRTYQIAKNADIRMQTFSRKKDNSGWNIDEKIDIKTFKAIFAPGSASPLKNVPYHVDIKGGVALAIFEKFVPR